MRKTGEVWRLGHRPALDGLRGVAILLVLAGHSYERLTGTWVSFDTYGVRVFFVLSGFLITTLLLEEREREGRVSFGRFYARRAGRLLPALALMLLYVAACGLATPKAMAATVLYVSNLYQVQTIDETLGFTWSLAVEEQFYLLWPLVLLAALRLGLRREGVAALALAGAGLSALARHLTDDAFAAERLPWTNADGLLLGCALACLMPLLVRWDRSNPAPGALAVRPLTLFGERSYALYLWHVPMIETLRLAGAEPRLSVPIGLCLTWAVSALSWRYVERPAQRWVRRRSETRPRLSPDPSYQPAR